MYKIQGELYHQIGPLRPEDGQALLYSQLYIYDATEALEHHQNNNPQTSPITMDFLQQLLLICNPFMTVYEQAVSLSSSHSLHNYRLQLNFLKATDQRHYNLPNNQ